MDVNRQATDAIAASILDHTTFTGAGSVPAEWKALSESFAAFLRNAQSQLPADKQTGFFDESTLTQAVSGYLRDRGLDHDPQFTEDLVDTALAADDRFEHPSSGTDFSATEGTGGGRDSVKQGGSPAATAMEQLPGQGGGKDSVKQGAPPPKEVNSGAGNKGNGISASTTIPNVSELLPDGISGADAVKKLEEADFLRFEGSQADKMRENFIKNIDESDFFRSALKYGLGQGKKFTFSNDPSLRSRSSHAAAFASSKDGRKLVWFGDAYTTRQVMAHEFFHASIGARDGGWTENKNAEYEDVPSSNQIAEAVFAEEIGVEDPNMDLYKKGYYSAADILDIDFDKFMANKGKIDTYGTDGTSNFNFRKFIDDSGNYKSKEDVLDDTLNGIVATYHDKINFNDRTVPSVTGELREQYETMFKYYFSVENQTGSNEDAVEWVLSQIESRLPGVYPDGVTQVDEYDDGTEATTMVWNYYQEEKHEGYTLLPEIAGGVREKLGLA
jgi:hypothetical protein